MGAVGYGKDGSSVGVESCSASQPDQATGVHRVSSPSELTRREDH